MPKPLAVGFIAVLGQETLVKNRPPPTQGILASFPVKILIIVQGWIARSHQRRVLGELDDHLLRDIGVSRQDALREAAKWFRVR